MTDNNNHLERLRAAVKGDTVTVPHGFESSSRGLRGLRNLRPGDVFTNDGGGPDRMPWKLNPGARSRGGNVIWSKPEDLAAHGLDVDGPAEDEDTDTDTDTDDGKQGTVYVDVMPVIDEEKWARTFDRVAAAVPDQVPALDDDQLGRVAALEHGLRVLESRRGPSESTGGLLEAFAGKKSSVPMVPAGDLVDVAAFIADGDTGREVTPDA